MAEERAELLVEIGTEELPPRSLAALESAFARGLVERLADRGLGHDEVRSYATPRRLAVHVSRLQTVQPAREVERRGPPAERAFDAEGRPTRAAEGFARSCGAPLEALEERDTGQGRYLFYRHTEPGRTAAELVPELVELALASLPVPRRMRWGAGETEFVRPVRWVVLLLGREVLPARFLGQATGRVTYGHRFHHPGPIELPDATAYTQLLYEPGRVVADRRQRQALIERQVREAAAGLQAQAQPDRALLEEVAALVEWPCPILGHFEERFLTLPPEVLVATLQGHQRYFPLWRRGRLIPAFVAISNIDSHDPEEVRRGNERVVRPRLADAEFFWRQDIAQPLDVLARGLGRVVFEERLGSLADKCQRVSELARIVARQAGLPEEPAARAAHLAKADLLSEMVGEFPELQGIMGAYYAERNGEPEAVVAAIRQQYQPGHAGDAIPEGEVARALGVADRLDTLAGIFSVGQRPSGDKDPFALRRAALGVMRILIEGQLDLDLGQLLDAACGLQPAPGGGGLAEELYDFMFERLRVHALEKGIRPDVFEAVLARRPRSPLDFQRRLEAVRAFQELPEARALAAANKRIGNIVRRADPEDLGATVAEDDLELPAERALYTALRSLEPGLSGLLAERDYTRALATLARLRETVDAFFEHVMVMAADARLRRNRLGLLQAVQERFMEIADVSRLQPEVGA